MLAEVSSDTTAVKMRLFVVIASSDSAGGAARRCGWAAEGKTPQVTPDTRFSLSSLGIIAACFAAGEKNGSSCIFSGWRWACGPRRVQAAISSDGGGFPVALQEGSGLQRGDAAAGESPGGGFGRDAG